MRSQFELRTPTVQFLPINVKPSKSRQTVQVTSNRPGRVKELVSGFLFITYLPLFDLFSLSHVKELVSGFLFITYLPLFDLFSLLYIFGKLLFSVPFCFACLCSPSLRPPLLHTFPGETFHVALTTQSGISRSYPPV